MKRALAVLALLGMLLSVPAFAQTKEPPVLFRALQVQYTAISWADYGMTSWALKSGQYGEANPLARFYVDKPGLAVPILAVTDILVHWGLDSVYRDNKTLGWVLLITFNVARGYILIHNLRQ